MVAVIFQFLYVLMVSVENIMGATCGSSGIPFRLEVLPNGQLVLGCASPSCFGGELGGRSVMHDSRFEEDEDGEDGFFREGDLKKPKRRHRNAPAELAECPQIFTLESCPASDSWVGGIKIEESGKLKVQCCTYEGLKFATEMGKPVVHAGEVFSGGEVIRDGRQTGFDLISNIKQIRETRNAKPSYELTVSRLSCIPDPPETTNYVDLNAQADIARIIYDKVRDGDEVSGTKTDQVVHQVIDPPYRDTVLQQNVVEEQQVPEFEQYQVVDHPVNVVEEQQVYQQPPVIQPSPVYYPVAYQYRRCFTGDTEIVTSVGLKTMKDLQIGDFVLTKEDNSVRYTIVKSFLHRLPNEKTDFIRLELSDGNILKITPYHFIYRTQCNSNRLITQMIYAKELQEGDCLFTTNSTQGQNQAYLLSKGMITETGAYAPLTESGDIIANNIYTSCHGHIRSSHLAHTFFYWIQIIQQWFFGNNWQEKIDLPFGTDFFISILDDIVPSS